MHGFCAKFDRLVIFSNGTRIGSSREIPQMILWVRFGMILWGQKKLRFDSWLGA